MGRGRAKAKQTKVARELKYSSHGTNLDALRAELSGVQPAAPVERDVDDDAVDELDDPYASYQDDDEDDEGSDQSGAGAR